MTDQELDTLMQRVLLDAIKLDWTAEPELDADFEPSAKHQRQVQAMLADPRSWARKRARPVWKKVLQRVAVVALTISLSFASVMAVSPTARATVIRWVTEWYETYIVYRYSGDPISEEMPQYEITELPEGFVETERDVHPASVSVVYKSSDGGIICFDYTYMQQGSAFTFVPENDDVMEIAVHNMPGTLFVANDPGDMNTITWMDSEANIQFVIDATLEKADILHIAESVSLVEQ